VPKEKKRNKGGTGIGLAYCKELVDLMKGKIQVESEEGKGSTFTVWFPAIDSIDPVGELVEPKIKPPTLAPGILATSGEDKEDERPVLLIIEDNRYVADIIVMAVGDFYQTLIAYDGKIGIEMAEKHLPDLIVSDIMMPEKNGFEVCEALKNQKNTSHIPIILLTAKDSFESEINGLKRGADVYMRKPFKKELLLVHLSGQLKRLKILQSRYEDLRLSLPPQDLGQKMEDEFVTTLLKHIKENLEEVSPGDLKDIVHMSPATLNRKLKAVTGKTPTQFINSTRLKIGKHLLGTTNKAIYQIADQVGFGSADHFSRAFRNLFDCSPSEYRNSLNNN